jgi:adenine-specific DNA-methyltransferase
VVRNHSRSSGPKGPTAVDAFKHDDKRTNIPTADAQEFITPEIEAVRKVRYSRDESLDPQLIWRSKYSDSATSVEVTTNTSREDLPDNDLIADAPPIYIQEKIDPRVLIKNLRRSSTKSDAPQPTLFESFDGLGELDAVDFYQHDANWSNRMILGDSLQVMASLAEREYLRGKVQMVYLDPPYGIKFGSNWQVSVKNRDVKDGKMESAVREAEQVKAFRDTWELGIHSYLSYLRDRLIAALDLLTESGSCFVQIGDENVHLVRSVMDEVFGSSNFVSMISFVTTSGFTQASALARNGDYLVWYARDIQNLKFRPQWISSTERPGYNQVEIDGERRAMRKEERSGAIEIPTGAFVYKAADLTSQGAASSSQEFEYEGIPYRPPANAHWKASFPDGMNRLAWAGRIHVGGKQIHYKRGVDDFPYQIRTNFWTDTGTGGFTEDKVYVVQTNTKVIERCMLLCTDPGDLVLDPTCGSGTTAHVAEQWGRRWITIDTSRVALALARQRLMASRYPWYLLADSAEGNKREQELTSLVNTRSTFAKDIRLGFVYERVQRVTLGAIANNPDIKEGMTRSDIDAAIKRHAEFELLFDRPYEDEKKVRVAGPFTVESLSPHRALSFGEAPESRTEIDGAKSLAGATFEQSVLENLAKAGIQNGKRAEKLKFESFESYAGQYVQAIGQQVATEADGAPVRVAIAVGPQYGTVSPSFMKKAAKEALVAEGIDLLAILGFAFDPQVNSIRTEEDEPISLDGFANIEGIRKLGKLPTLIVRMNTDLLMGEELKKTGVGNLFTVFGEPDIELRETDEGYVVDLRGVDVYDPTTGEIRSNDTGQIALWMIDTDYNEESFFVRHCYFTGGNDPYKRLKTALKEDIDEESWSSLYATTSRLFPRPSTGKIAVKVINDFGDEVMKVFELSK